MARRKVRPPGVTAEDRERALEEARVLTSYMLQFEVDDTRRKEAREMSAAELRELVAEFPTHAYGRRIPELLDVAEGGVIDA